jgi:hypothetical protein
MRVEKRNSAGASRPLMFLSYILARNARVEEDLVDQPFNPTEKCLARLLLLLAKFGNEGRPEPVLGKSQPGGAQYRADRGTRRTRHAVAASQDALPTRS